MLSSNELYLEDMDEGRLKRLKRANEKKIIEAMLFTSRKIISLKEICSLFPEKKKEYVQRLIYELIEDYSRFKTSIEIVELTDQRFEMKIKDEIVNSMEIFTVGKLLRKSDIKTLATIAFLQPEASKKKIYDILGRTSTIYKNVSNLKKLDFIKDVDKKFLLTRHFYDYFQIKKENSVELKKILKKFI